MKKTPSAKKITPEAKAFGIVLSKRPETEIYEPIEGVKIYLRRVPGWVVAQLAHESVTDTTKGTPDADLHTLKMITYAITKWEGVGRNSDGVDAEVEPSEENVKALCMENAFIFMYLRSWIQSGFGVLPLEIQAIVTKTLSKPTA